ncbi:glycosyltransferase family 4 protein [Cephaloticoccus primus]|uniref:glycosyltransferase family 4 protein n=1 Tax=Cephaloticoccus primus TaxID=1548207 RepID=UPI0009EEF995|nr:glycosyltransferase family 4 protein [Cephaloticoccus primus]
MPPEYITISITWATQKLFSMKITIVNGFFLPMPPEKGGATEKMWWRLAQIYAKRGHSVTLISRCWYDWPDEEYRNGVHLIRIPGADYRSRLWKNLLLDARWGCRVLRTLPPADILITNTIALPIFAPYLRQGIGKLVINLNRYPKGQLNWYRHAARIQVPTGTIADAAKAQAPKLAPRIKLIPNPIDVTQFQLTENQAYSALEPLKVGFFGRIHPEKGVHTLVRAALILEERQAAGAAASGQPWQLVLRGPTDVALGGGGEEYTQQLYSLAPKLWSSKKIIIKTPIFNPEELAKAYSELTIFCYPSEALKGETHGISILEAMASGLPVVASDLPVFQDYLNPGTDSLMFPMGNAQKLADALFLLLNSPDLRQKIGATAHAATLKLDDSVIADQHLADYESLLSESS